MSSPSRYRTLQVDEDKGTAVVNFVDNNILDEQNIQVTGDDLRQLINERGYRNILLNFSGVDFMSSMALGKLLSIQRMLQKVKGKLAIVGLAKDIADVFRLTKLDKLLPIVNTYAEALVLFGDEVDASSENKSPPQMPTSGLSDSASTEVPPEDPLIGNLTADEIRHIDQEGMTLGYAIRALEASWE